MESIFFSDFENEKGFIRELIEDGSFENAINRLRLFEAYVPNDYAQRMRLQMFRVKSLARDANSGEYTREEIRIRKNQLANALDFLVDEIGKGIKIQLRMNKLPSFVSNTLKDEGLERILSKQSQIRPINFLWNAIAVSKSICRIETGKELGTGFMLRSGYVMTCQHVLETARSAAGAKVVFSEWDEKAKRMVETKYKLDNTTYFSSPHTERDYAIIKPLPEPVEGHLPLSHWGCISPNSDFPQANDANAQTLMVIQHAGGRDKNFAFASEAVIKIDSLDLYHRVDTKKGSSGAPILDMELRVVGVHNSGLKHSEGGFPIGPNGENVAANKGSLIDPIERDIYNRGGLDLEW